MLRYILSRLLFSAVTILAVITIVFGLTRLSGDPTSLLAPQGATADDIEALRRGLGLDGSIFQQYWTYVSGLAQGDLGQSTSYSAPVRSLISTALPQTLLLGGAAFLFAIGLGVPLGLLAGMRGGSRTDAAVRVISLVGQSVPSFWLGILLVLVFAVNLRWFPAFGTEGLSSLILPAITLGAYPLASITRLTRSAALEIMTKDQTLFTRTHGVSPIGLARHVLRNASLPVVTMAAIIFGGLLSSTIVVEVIFAWPGLGQLAVQGFQRRDFALVQGVVLTNTALFVFLLLLVDLSYGLLDPRVRSSRGRQ